jgi:hypothetical protein
VNSGGVGFLGFLTLLFIGLKLGGVINWSWWLVLLPLYGPFALALGIITIIFAACGLGVGVAKIANKFTR